MTVAPDGTAESSDPLLCRRQGGQPPRCLRGFRDSPLRPRDRFRLVLLSDQADLSDAPVLRQAVRQFRPGHPAADPVRQAAVLPARQQILQRDEQDEALAARDPETARALSRRQGAPAAGDDGALQTRRRQPAGRLPADRDPDPGVLLALQGAVRHDRDAARAVLRLDPRSVGARPDLVRQSLRPPAVRAAARS